MSEATLKPRFRKAGSSALLLSLKMDGTDDVHWYRWRESILSMFAGCEGTLSKFALTLKKLAHPTFLPSALSPRILILEGKNRAQRALNSRALQGSGPPRATGDGRTTQGTASASSSLSVRTRAQSLNVEPENPIGVSGTRPDNIPAVDESPTFDSFENIQTDTSPLSLTEAIDLEELKELRKAEVRELQKSKTLYNEAFVTAQNMILESLAPETKRKLAEKTAYIALTNDPEPLALYRLIMTLYSGQSQGKSDEEIKYERLNAYHLLVMRSNESVSEYRERFESMVSALEEFKCHVPSKQQQAIRFKDTLDPKRFTSFIAEWANARSRGDSQHQLHLASVSAMAEYASAYVDYRGRPVDTSIHASAFASVEKKKKVKRNKAHGIRDNRGANSSAACLESASNNAVSNTACVNSNDTVRVKYNCPICDSSSHAAYKCPKLEAAKRAVNATANVAQGFDNTRKVLIDSGANYSLFGDIRLLSRVRTAPEPMMFTGINGSIRCTQTGMFLDVIPVFYSSESSVNLLSLNAMRSCAGVAVQYNNVANTFYVTIRDKQFAFAESDGLYAKAFLTTTDMESEHPKQEVAAAQKARDFSRRLGVPASTSVKQLLLHNSKSTLAFEPRHLELAKKLYGPRIAELAGKKTEPRNIDVNPRHLLVFEKTNQTMYSDVMFVLQEPYLISVFKPLGLIITTCMTQKATKNLRMAIKSQVLLLKRQGFYVSRLLCDGDKAFGANTEDLQAVNIRLEIQPTKHINEVERAIRLVKEWSRGVVVELPFKLPAILVKDLITFITQRINFFPSKRGGHNFSALEAFTGSRLDLDLDVRAAFGDYTHVVTPNLGIRKGDVFTSRTEPCIALYNAGRKGAVVFFSLLTRKRITRDSFTIIPTPPDVIATLNGWAQDPTALLHSLETAGDAEQDLLILPEIVEPVQVQIPDFQQQDDNVIFIEDPDIIPIAEEFPGVAEPTQTEIQYAEDDTITAALEPAPEVQQSEPTPEFRSPYNLRRNPKAKVWHTKVIARKRNSRTKKKSHYACALHVSMRRMMKTRPEATSMAVKEELRQMLEKKCFTPMVYDEMSTQRQKNSIRSFLFLKEKFDAAGNFTKMKARLVADGSRQDYLDVDNIDTSSPTAQLSSVLIVAATAAMENRTVCTADIKGAFLNAVMPADQIVDVLLDAETSSELIAIDPSYKKYSRRDGCLAVKLNKALYGCRQSSRLWFEELKGLLLRLGFVMNPYDPCVYNKMFEGRQFSVVIYVDDLLMTCYHAGAIKWLTEELDKAYDGITTSEGKAHSYVGMFLDFSNAGVLTISLKGFERSIRNEGGVHGTVLTPALDNLFDIDPVSPKLGDHERQVFHTMTAKLLYLSKRVRPDVFLAVSFLTTRVQCPTQEDRSKLDRVLKYLNHKPEVSLVFGAAKAKTLEAYIDASYGTHQESGYSHSGCVITYGGGPVLLRSNKQKIVTKSSYEAELVALSDCGTDVMYLRHLMHAQGLVEEPTKIFQDNKGLVITMNSSLPSTSSKSRHIPIRYFWLRDQVAKKQVIIEHIRTQDMIADILTKALQGPQFQKLAAAVRGDNI
jgi:hypothetical protein